MADKKVYTEEEKKTILARAEEIGVRKAAEEAGAAWQAVARWKKATEAAVTATVEKVEEEAKKVEAEVKADVEKVEEKAKKTSTRAKNTADKAAKTVKADAKKTTTRAKKAADKTAKTTAEKIKDEVKAVEKKTEKAIKTATRGKRMISTITIQSPLGGEITPEDIRAKVGDVDHIYVRVDQNKAYWVKGDETGSVDLW